MFPQNTENVGTCVYFFQIIQKIFVRIKCNKGIKKHLMYLVFFLFPDYVLLPPSKSSISIDIFVIKYGTESPVNSVV